MRVQLRVDRRLPGPGEITAYYVAAVAFTNAAKHADASAVDILIEEAGGTLTMQVRDDGAGGADESRGSGLTGLRDRVEAVGGRMTVNSPGRGRHRPNRTAPDHPNRSLIRTGRGCTPRQVRADRGQAAPPRSRTIPGVPG